jgi:thioesterase domain-containing protein
MREIGNQRPIYGLQVSGILPEGPFPSSVEALVHEYVEAIQQVQPSGPYYLLGWSFGGVVAQAIACRLQQQGERVGLLTILDSFPSTDEREKPAMTEQEVVCEYMALIGLRLNDRDAKPPDFATAFAAAQNAGLIPADFDEDVTRRMIQMMSHNSYLERAFRSPQFRGDLLFFEATGKGKTRPISPQAWAPYVTGYIEVHKINCKHHEMMDPVPSREIGSILEKSLRLQD